MDYLTLIFLSNFVFLILLFVLIYILVKKNKNLKERINELKQNSRK